MIINPIKVLLILSYPVFGMASRRFLLALGRQIWIQRISQINQITIIRLEFHLRGNYSKCINLKEAVEDGTIYALI